MQEVKIDTIPSSASNSVTQLELRHFSLAHLSDLHLTTLIKARPHQLLNKRLFGYLSWLRKRRIVHRLDVVSALLQDLKQRQPDHIAVTGDLTHLGLPSEFAEASRWISLLGTPKQVTLVPGNHEAYVGKTWHKHLSVWAPYLASDEQQKPCLTENFYPSLRVRGPVAIIGLCSASPSLPFLATGKLGKDQLAVFEKILSATKKRGLLRIVLIHHPPVPGSIKWRKRLVDSSQFASVIARQGAELVLHGHTHAQITTALKSPNGMTPVIGAPSTSEVDQRHGRNASYNIYKFVRTELSWRLTMAIRTYSEKTGQFFSGREVNMVLPGSSFPYPVEDEL
jgi:3',5'-cyclic AMP phosphodiesterase CpdA